MELEKERAQLDLDLERLNAERIKLQIELDTLSGRAEQQQQELEAAKAQLEIQTEKLKRQREALEQNDYEPVEERPQPKKQETSVSKKYKLINVVGVDNQLQATIEDIASGQNRRIAVGKELDGYVVKSISLNEGIVFEKDGIEESLNIGK
jgi:type IV pilus biogenesis protein PilP